jgi:hypothetical protein
MPRGDTDVKVTSLRFPLLTIVGLAVLAACKGPAGPALGGTWQGFVYLHDEYGAPLIADSNVTVTALPTSATSTTGPNGLYSFTSLTTGVYSLRYNFTGLGTYLLANQQFVGGGIVQIPGVNLGKQSTGVMSNLTFTPNAGGDTIIAMGTITAPPPGISRYVRFFFDLQPAVVGTSVTSWTVTLPANGPPYAVSGSSFSVVITGQDLRALQHGFAGGATVNAIGYGESYFENSYPDPTASTGKPVFPNLCSVSSQPTTFTMPPH